MSTGKLNHIFGPKAQKDWSKLFNEYKTPQKLIEKIIDKITQLNPKDGIYSYRSTNVAHNSPIVIDLGVQRVSWEGSISNGIPMTGTLTPLP
jgi:endonuclease III